MKRKMGVFSLVRVEAAVSSSAGPGNGSGPEELARLDGLRPGRD